MPGLDLSTGALVVIVLACVLGGIAQSSLGFGGAFSTVPALALVAPVLLPTAVLVSVLPMAVYMAAVAWRDVDVAGLGRLSIGRFPGIAAGAWIAGVLSTRALTAATAVLVLVAIGATVAGWRLEVTRQREIVAGFLSGLTGTAAGLGGPPLALLYRDRPGRVLRATLAAVWTVGLLPALFGLWLAGRFAAVHLVAGGLMAVATLVGMAGGLRLVHVVPERAVRAGILWWSALGSLVALGRSLAG